MSKFVSQKISMCFSHEQQNFLRHSVILRRQMAAVDNFCCELFYRSIDTICKKFYHAPFNGRENIKVYSLPRIAFLYTMCKASFCIGN